MYRKLTQMPCLSIPFFLDRKKNGEIVDVNNPRVEGGHVDSIGLKMRQVLRHDLGNYTCELQNDYGIGSSENAISLDVHCKYISLDNSFVSC